VHQRRLAQKRNTANSPAQPVRRPTYGLAVAPGGSAVLQSRIRDGQVRSRPDIFVKTEPVTARTSDDLA